jgi:hypothetical protein
MTCVRPEDDSRLWRTADAVHIDVRDLEAPEPMIAILRAIDGGEIDGALVAHLDREPIFLYPELDDRGWGYELLASSCESPGCDEGVMLRMVRWGS